MHSVRNPKDRHLRHRWCYPEVSPAAVPPAGILLFPSMIRADLPTKAVKTKGRVISAELPTPTTAGNSAPNSMVMLPFGPGPVAPSIRVSTAVEARQRSECGRNARAASRTTLERLVVVIDVEHFAADCDWPGPAAIECTELQHAHSTDVIQRQGFCSRACGDWLGSGHQEAVVVAALQPRVLCALAIGAASRARPLAITRPKRNLFIRPPETLVSWKLFETPIPQVRPSVSEGLCCARQTSSLTTPANSTAIRTTPKYPPLSTPQFASRFELRLRAVH